MTTHPVMESVHQVSLSGFHLINSPRLNKGTAFTDHERDIFHLHGLLPPHVGTLEEQLSRRMQALDEQSTPFNKYAFLATCRIRTRPFSMRSWFAMSRRCCRWCTHQRWARAASASARYGESREACSLATQTKIASTRS